MQIVLLAVFIAAVIALNLCAHRVSRAPRRDDDPEGEMWPNVW